MNRELVTRDPKHLVLVTSVWLKQHPELREVAESFYDVRADRTLDNGFLEQVRATGYVHTPLFIADVEGVGDVIVAGRQRYKAAMALGLSEIPCIYHDPSVDLSIELELTENLARSENTVLESAAAYKKALQKGITKEKLAALAGLSETEIYNTILVGELPKFVRDMIDKGELTKTAALQLTKTYGEKAPKGSGLTKVYSEENQKKMKEHLDSMSLEAKLQGGGKRVTVKQARSSHPKAADELVKKNWKAILEDTTIADDFRALIQVFIGEKSWQVARGEYPDSLYFLEKKDPTPKPKVEKEAKPKKTKSEKAEAKDESFDPASLFQ